MFTELTCHFSPLLTSNATTFIQVHVIVHIDLNDYSYCQNNVVYEITTQNEGQIIVMEKLFSRS